MRCTYADDARWSSFLTKLKQLNPLSVKLTDSQPWTVVEDRDSLADATMKQACQVFQNWVNTVGSHENQGQIAMSIGRNFQFIYVNEESIESVLNPARASEKTGNFLVLVDVRDHLASCEEKEADYRKDYNRDQDIRDVLADVPDTSWKLITANEYKGHYLQLLREWDPWWGGMNEFNSAPYVHPANLLGPGDMNHCILYPDNIGFDAYRMLKHIYGKGYVRSACFELDSAETGLQRMCGYAGGERKEEYTYPWYL